MYGLNKAGTTYELLQGPILYTVPPPVGTVTEFGISVSLDKTGNTLAVGAGDYGIDSIDQAGAGEPAILVDVHRTSYREYAFDPTTDAHAHFLSIY